MRVHVVPRRASTWQVLLAAGALATVVGWLIGPELRSLFVPVVAVAGQVIVYLRIRRLPPDARSAWLVLWLAGLIILVASLVRFVHGVIIGVDTPLPSPADALFFVGYALLVLGELILLRRRATEPDPDAWVDALIVSAAVGLALWAVLISPYLRTSGSPVGEQVVNVTYLLLTLALLATTVRLIVGPGIRPVAYYLLAGAVAVFFVNDLLGTIAFSRGLDPEVLLVLTPPVYAFYAAAIYHPSAPRLTDAPPDQESRLGPVRLTMLFFALMTPPLVLVYELRAETAADPVLIVSGAFLTSVLVLVRLARLVWAKERTAALEGQLRRAGEDLVSAVTVDGIHRTSLQWLREILGDGVGVAGMLAPSGGRWEVTAASDEDRAEALVHCLPRDASGHVSLEGCTQDDLAHAYLAPLRSVAEDDGVLFVAGASPQGRDGRLVVEALAREAALALRGVEMAEEMHRQRSERRFKVLVENSSDVVTVVDGGHRVIFCSPAARRILGREPEALVGQAQYELVHPDDRPLVRAFLASPDADDESAGDPLEVRLLHADGTYRWFEVVTRDLREQDEIGGVVVNFREITDRKGAEQRLANSEARFRALVQNSSDVVAVVDDDALFTYVSPAITGMLGYRADDLLGTSVLGLLPTDEAGRVEALRRTLTSESFRQTSVEVRIPDVRGAWHTVDITITDLRREPAVGGVVLNARDVTVRKELEHDLRHQALHDTLTGLGNRAMFTGRVTEALEQGEDRLDAVSVLFVDLDDFKTVNDSLGHAVGDQLLVVAAERLRECLRVSDTAARLGGDEFAVLLEHAYGQSEVIQVAERILESLRQPIVIGPREIVVTASVGIAMNSDRSTSAEVLLRNADMAMYLAKDRGKARFEVFEDEMHASVFERLEMKAALARAIDQADELELHYQPIMSLASGRVTGVEALVRWQHPDRGLLAPGSFIPLAEDTGLIVPLGRWVLEQACRQLVTWREEVPGAEALTMSVNLSVRQLGNPTIVADIVQILERTGLPAECLVLEITESLLVDERSTMPERLTELRAVGVSLAVDDFGTGYSSLGYLQRFPIDIIKIDRSFVEGLGQGADEPGVVRAIIDVARRIGARTVAEGIQGAEQLKALKALRCDGGQGFYFARPMPADDFTDRLAGITEGDVRLRLEEPV